MNVQWGNEFNLVKVIAQKHGNDGKWYVHTETHKVRVDHNFERWQEAICAVYAEPCNYETFDYLFLEPCNYLATTENLLLRSHLEVFNNGDEALRRVTEIADELSELLDSNESVFDDGEGVIISMEMRFHSCHEEVDLDAYGQSDDWFCTGMEFEGIPIQSSLQVFYQYRLWGSLSETDERLGIPS